jgi:superfamily I DNA/RNA helicase
LDSDGLKKMRESEVLTLSTIHGAKGLEFSHVWLVQMAEVCTICMRERERERVHVWLVQMAEVCTICMRERERERCWHSQRLS